ncbi:unnamed protein product [Symbiodinium sp. CCMP2592]|nr:unnamed protein product [Symbiodinium sp. CCMP2592]
MIREVLQELLNGDLKSMITGLLVGRQPGTSRPSLATPPAGEVDEDKNGGKGERWKKRRKLEEMAGKGHDASTAPAKGKGADGKGKNNSGEPAQEPHHNGEKAAGKGKSGGADQLAGKGKSDGNALGGATGKPDNAEAEWTVVGRRGGGDWKLRAADWSDPILSYEELVRLAAEATAVVRAVAMVNEEQRDTLCALFRGSGKGHALLLVEPRQAPDSERCPGTIGGKLVFKPVIFTRACSSGVDPPRPKVKAAGCKVEIQRSSVIFVRFVQRYMDKEAWGAALKLKAMDTWGWAVEPGPGGDGQQVFGKCRLADGDVAGLLATSGSGAFFDPSRGFHMGPVVTEWQQQQDRESNAAYLARCLTLPADYGLVVGRKQLGKRMKHDAGVPVQRLWLAEGVPSVVTADQLSTVLGTFFEEVEMIHQRRRGGCNNFTFRAKTAEQADSMVVPLDYGDESITLWVRHAPPRDPHFRGLVSFGAAGQMDHGELLNVTVELDGEKDGEAEAPTTNAEDAGNDATMQQPANAGEAAGKGDHKRGSEAAGPAAKRVINVQRRLPEGATVTKIAKDGNCLFSAIAMGVHKLNPAIPQVSAAEARAKIAVHLRRNADRYERDWDRELPNKAQAKDWEEYVKAIEVDAVWGGLTEIRAACRIWDIRCIIFPTCETIEPFHVHGQAKKRVVALQFSGSHYDLIEGDNGSLPKALLSVKGAPEAVPMRGGGRDPDGAFVDGAGGFCDLQAGGYGGLWAGAFGDFSADCFGDFQAGVFGAFAAGHFSCLGLDARFGGTLWDAYLGCLFFRLPDSGPFRPDEPADWRCPMAGCSAGVPAGFKAKVSKAVFAEVRGEHRRRSHRHLTRAAYAARLRAAAHCKPAERMRCRVSMLNRFRAQHAHSVKAGARPSSSDFVAFTWPLLLRRKTSKKHSVLRLTLASAWRLAATFAHGVDPIVLDRAFDSALVHLLGELFRGPRACEILAVQELELRVESLASFVATLRQYSVHVFPGEPTGGVYRCAILTTLPCKPVAIEVVCPSRVACAVFEFLCNGDFMKVLVASYYGCQSDKQIAVDGAMDLACALRGTAFNWVILGDCNVDLLEEPMIGAVANGLVWPWDDVFQHEEMLPGTKESGRRLDYAVGNGALVPSSVHQCWWHSDHAMVTYDGPFSAFPTNALATGQVDVAWTLLSDAAEGLLAEPGSAGVARSSSWKPRPQQHPRSKAAGGREPLLVVQLNRLWRRLLQLRRRPSDHRLRDRVSRQACDLSSRAPWLRDLPYFEAEAWCDWMREQIDKEEKAQQAAAISAWRQRLDKDPKELATWIRRRDQLGAELSRPTTWMARWGKGHGTGQVEAILRQLPQLPQCEWRPEITGDSLLRAAKTMVTKAAGPDDWPAKAWLCLPRPFWDALSQLWQAVLRTHCIPQRWREGRVALIAKPSGGHRPLTVLALAWRLGSKILVRCLDRWVDDWAGHRVLGGVHRRGLSDAFMRLRASLSEPRCYVQQDLSRFFDSIHLSDLLATMRRLGAPQGLCGLVSSFYEDHRRVFSSANVLGGDWHRVRCGLAQGCPLSPLLAGTVMWAWHEFVESGSHSELSSCSFVDDRLLWSRSADVLRRGKLRSDVVDAAYDFTCDVDKCRFAFRGADPAALALRDELGYASSEVLVVLGLVVPLDPATVPSLRDFDLKVVQRRLRLIGAATHSLPNKRRLLLSLVLPLFTWAGGHAFVGEEALTAVLSAFRHAIFKDLAVDAPFVLGYEAARLQVSPPVWIEEESVDFAAKRWLELLPGARLLLDELQWWSAERGRFICRRDSYGVERRFELGVDSLEVLFEWLRDERRRAGLAGCGRVFHSLHRPDPLDELAGGLTLPAPPRGSLCLFAGHRQMFARAADAIDRASAMATGCSTWHKAKRNSGRGSRGADRAAPSSAEVCLCGRKLPSRPHLAWACEATAPFRANVPPPVNRAEERLFSRVVPELPRPPDVLDPVDVYEDIAAVLDGLLQSESSLTVAVDGSTCCSLAAWAVSFADRSFSLGVQGEDQSSFRAEIEALWALLRSLQLCSGSGVIHVVCDCQSAITVALGGGQLAGLSRRFVAFRRELEQRFTIHLWWTPSHGKVAPSMWRPPPCGEVVARALNAKADAAARSCAGARANGSLRKTVMEQREAALSWEVKALTALNKAARAWAVVPKDAHGRSRLHCDEWKNLEGTPERSAEEPKEPFQLPNVLRLLAEAEALATRTALALAESREVAEKGIVPVEESSAPFPEAASET